MQLAVLSWNILAPVWAHPQWYDNVDRACLDGETRLGLIIDTLTQRLAAHADLVLLCEVEASVYERLREVLEPEYEAVPLGCHREDCWADNLVDGAAPVPNGNAIFARRSLLRVLSWERFELSADDGNCALAAVLEYTPSGTRLVAAVSHLDTESAARRELQLHCARRTLDGIAATHGLACPVVWGGDFNASVEAPELRVALAGEQAFTVASHGRRVAPSDFGSVLYGFGDVPIDHVLVRGASVQPGSALEADVWVFEHLCGGRSSPATLGPRFEWTLRTYGSDHMPVGCTLVLPHATSEQGRQRRQQLDALVEEKRRLQHEMAALRAFLDEECRVFRADMLALVSAMQQQQQQGHGGASGDEASSQS